MEENKKVIMPTHTIVLGAIAIVVVLFSLWD